MKRGRRIGTYRYVEHARAAWYLARGWQPFDLGRYHSNFSIGMFKRWPR
jgi:hypothetical protein